MKSSTKTMLALHILLAVYSVGNVFSKLAADVPFLSPRFILDYGIVLLDPGHLCHRLAAGHQAHAPHHGLCQQGGDL